MRHASAQRTSGFGSAKHRPASSSMPPTMATVLRGLNPEWAWLECASGLKKRGISGYRDRGRSWCHASCLHAAAGSSRMIRLALVDDQALVRRGIRSLLELDGSMEVVAEAADGPQAKAAGVETRGRRSQRHQLGADRARHSVCRGDHDVPRIRPPTHSPRPAVGGLSIATASSYFGAEVEARNVGRLVGRTLCCCCRAWDDARSSSPVPAVRLAATSTPAWLASCRFRSAIP